MCFVCFICFLCLVCLLCRGLRRSRPAALPSIAYRGFAVAPMTLRAPSRRFLYNSGCRVATLLVSMGVMGFLGDLRGRNSKSPPNPLGLAERVYSFHRPRGGPPPSRREVWGFALPLEDSHTTPGAGHTKKISAQHPSPPLRRINQPFQRVDAAYALVIGGRVVVERQNQFGV